MTDNREGRGRRVLGGRLIRVRVVAGLALLALSACAPLAWGASGGAGTSPSGKPKPARRHTTTKRHTTVHATRSGPFRGRGMWIWYIASSNDGSLQAIIARAHRNGIRTLLIKSGDGTSTWSQFNHQLVSTLHANGLQVCGWQFVYGDSPGAEAQVGAAAASAGADCLIIDAEGQYEGKYVQAQTYIKSLRRLVGSNYPLALAGFPYVDYHPAFPYSVFLGPGGAQYNVPQMYWVDIGTTVEGVYAHTYAFNRPYQRQIAPLGQVYNSPPANDIRRFRQLSGVYGAPGISWWDWQEATWGAWHALSQATAPARNFTPDTSLASLGRGAQGDLVVWAQEHLVKAGQRVTIDGAFGPGTTAAVKRFQRASGLSADGLIGTATWHALLRYAAATVRWTSGGARIARVAGGGTLPPPKSASLPAKRYEIPRAGGAGYPKP
jgi:hypothetical protein